MADSILIDQVLQYLNKAPGHKWECFTLGNVEYFDVDLLDLDYEPYNGANSEVLQFNIVLQKADTEHFIIPCNIRRSETHIILTPELVSTITNLSLLGTRASIYNQQCINGALRLYTNVAIEIESLERFIDGDLNEIWKIKPEY